MAALLAASLLLLSGLPDGGRPISAAGLSVEMLGRYEPADGSQGASPTSDRSTTPACGQGQVVHGPFVSTPIQPVERDVDLRDLPQWYASSATGAERTSADEVDASNPPPREESLGTSSPVDPIAQTTNPPLVMPLPTHNFAGLLGSYPTDANGDVGTRHYVQAVNVGLGVFDKASGERLAAVDINDLFDGTNTPCDDGNWTDPVVVYDHLADRWVFIDVATSNHLCLAMSKNDDPVSGGWWLYAYPVDQLPDFPKLTVWPDGYYATLNTKPTRVLTFGREAMLSGQSIRAVHFEVENTIWGNILPSNLEGEPPPEGTPNFYLYLDVSPRGIDLWRFHVDWTSPSNSTFVCSGPVGTSPIQLPPNTVPQLGTSQELYANWNLNMQVQYRRIAGVESLWATSTVGSNGVASIRWQEIRDPSGTPYLYQEGTYQPDANHRWMGSLAVDRMGNMAVGYSVTSSSMYPGIRYSGRMAQDRRGMLREEQSLIEGTAAQTDGSRWGDYTAMAIDPVDGCTFWYTNQYYALVSYGSEAFPIRQTRIGSFRFPWCQPTIYLPIILNNAQGP